MGGVMRILRGGLFAVLLAASIGRRTLDAAAPCESLTSMTLPNTTITLARFVEAGAFTPPAPAGAPGSPPTVQAPPDPPAVCRHPAPPDPASDSHNQGGNRAP